MATADEYAAWIVANAAKKGTPEFETVAKAYELAKSETAQPAAEPAPTGRRIQSFQRGPSPEDIAAAKAAQAPETTAVGLAGAASRGALPYLTGPALGGVVGGLVAGPPGAALGAAGVGAAQAGLEALIPAINERLGTNIQTPGHALEALADVLGIARPQTAAERMVQTGVGAALGARGMVEAGRGLAQAGAPLARAAGGLLAAGEAEQVAGAAASGLASQAAAEVGADPATQAVAGLIGGVAGSRAARTKVSAAPVAPQKLVAEAERAGVPVMTSDISPPTTFMGKAAQAAGERVPFVGTGPVRAEQQAARVEAVRDLAREFGATTVAAASEDVMAGLTAARSAKLSQLTRIKGDVINSLVPAGAMPVARTTAAIDQQIAKLQSLKTKEVEPVIKRLEDWRQSVQGQDIGNIELLRKQLGESFKAPELANVRSTGEKALSSIYGAIRDDMSDFIKTNGQPKDLDKWSVANRELSSMARELKTTSLRSTLERGEATPEAVARMIFSEKPSDVKLLYRNLNDKGKEAAKTAVIARAIEKATVGEDVSPEKFRAQLDKLGPQIGVFFKGDDLQRVKGLERVLSATRRAAEAGVQTPTGQQLYPVGQLLGAGAAGQAVGKPLAGFAALGTAGLAARLYESAPVRNLLLKLPTVKTGSPEEAALLKRIIAAVRPTQPTEEQPTP
jgi:hypothetical protein